MSEKQTCPKCDSHTSSVHRAWLDGEPCPYCDDDLTRLPTPPCPTCGRPLAADSRPVVSEAAITEVLLRHREAQWNDGRSGCSPCGNHAEVTTREEAQAAQAIGHMDSYTDYCSHIAAALTAALPHMGDGKGDGA